MRSVEVFQTLIKPAGLSLAVIALLALTQCQGAPVPPSTATAPPATPESPTATRTQGLSETATPVPTRASPERTAGVSYSYTHQQPDGNRIVSGRGSMLDTEPVDVALAGTPYWVVAAPTQDGSIWAVVLDDGQVQALRVADGDATEIGIAPSRVERGMPPLLEVEAGVPQLVTVPTSRQSAFTHPVPLDEAGTRAFISVNGDLVVIDNEREMGRLAVNALPDARLLQDERGRLTLLTDPTTRYTHGVLGDEREAASITLVDPLPEPRVVRKIEVPEPQVVEGIAPIWADLDGDGEREIIVTVSDAGQGARIVVFNESGERQATGPAIGQGFRWRHQLAVAPFGPNGELELADVLTPHIGGTVDFYRLEGESLRIVAQVPGYTSHVIGTRNLDLAVAGDFDGDGRVELLVPNQERTQLGGIRHTTDGAVAAWTVSVGGRVSSNLAGVTLADGRLAVGVGREDDVLRLWLP